MSKPSAGPNLTAHPASGIPSRTGHEDVGMLPRLRAIGRSPISRLVGRCLSLLGTASALLPVMAVRALRPLFLVRFGVIRSDRIGDFANAPEYYLCQRDEGTQEPRAIDLLYYSHNPVCNHQLKVMIDRTLKVFGLVKWLDRANRTLPGGKAHTVTIISRVPRHHTEIHRLLSRTKNHLSFTEDEEKRGTEGLRAIGVPGCSPFVCFHARDSAYLDTTFPNKDWRYHDYRNSTIHNYVPAVAELTRRGYSALRMGSVVKEPLATDNPMIIDYADRGRTEFLDIFLSARCRFFITSGTGIDSVANSFRRPVACVNYLPLGYARMWGPLDLFILKHLWLRQEGRFMSFREALEGGVAWFSRGEEYEERGIDVIENSPEEITALVLEMDDRLNGTWQGEDEDEELQRRFWSVFPASEEDRPYLPRIGAEFLRRNRGLLD